MKEKNHEFISVCPNGKQASCLENFRKFSVKALQGILKHCHEKISGKKEDLLMKIFVIFCRCQPKLQSQQLPSDSFMDHTTYCTFKILFSCILSNAIWKMTLEKYQILNFFSNTIILLLFLRNTMVICYEDLFIKDWNHSSFFMRVISKQWSYVPLNYLFMFILKQIVKPSMKNNCYNITVKFIRESEDIIAAWLVLDQVSSVLENAVMLVQFFFCFGKF